MKNNKERRKRKRWKVAVLVRCQLPQFSKDMLEMEMWAKDVNEKGLKLEWTRGLGVSRVPANGRGPSTHSIRFDDIKFNKGSKVMVQDLFYDDEGSPFLEGKILWARQTPSSGNWSLGIQLQKMPNPSKEHLGAFKDFIAIVKNPTAAISKASKRR